jgi:hypothetical protein
MIRLVLIAFGLGACSFDASGLERLAPKYVPDDAGAADTIISMDVGREALPIDVGPDVGAEAKPEVAGLDAAGSDARAGWPGGAKCNPITNTGCPSGTSCFFTCQMAVKGVQCTSEPGGALIGTACDSYAPASSCAPGGFCYNGTPDIGPGLCYRLCESDADCPSKRCRIMLPCTRGVPAGAGLCEP